jgi:hypothetical protein
MDFPGTLGKQILDGLYDVVSRAVNGNPLARRLAAKKNLEFSSTWGI